MSCFGMSKDEMSNKLINPAYARVLAYWSKDSNVTVLEFNNLIMQICITVNYSLNSDQNKVVKMKVGNEFCNINLRFFHLYFKVQSSEMNSDTLWSSHFRRVTLWQNDTVTVLMILKSNKNNFTSPTNIVLFVV